MQGINVEPPAAKLTAAAKLSVGSISVAARYYYSASHLIAAAQFVRLAKALEDRHGRSLSGEPFNEHRSYVVGTIVFVAAFLEAAVNEVFIDAVEGHDQYISVLSGEVKHALAEAWPLIEKRTLLEKAQYLLGVDRKGKLPRGANPYQDVESLVSIRNALTHARPEWNPHGEDWTREGQLSRRLAQRLQGKFLLHPVFSGSNNPFFPDKCLSHGCASWTLRAGVAFTDELFSRTGITPAFSHLLPPLH